MTESFGLSKMDRMTTIGKETFVPVGTMRGRDGVLYRVEVNDNLTDKRKSEIADQVAVGNLETKGHVFRIDVSHLVGFLRGDLNYGSRVLDINENGEVSRA